MRLPGRASNAFARLGSGRSLEAIGPAGRSSRRDERQRGPTMGDVVSRRRTAVMAGWL